MSRQAIANALSVPNERAERLIADALGVSASTIWPSRYRADGRRLRPQPPTNYHRTPRFARTEEFA